MIDGILLLWFILTALSLVFVIWDQFTNTPSLRIMTLAWVLVIIYTGPLGLFIYFTSCRQPLPGTHDAFIKAHWKQAIGSEIHCVAGDATAIIIMAGILYYFNLPNGIEAILEYIAAYLFGLFIFQALFMRSMFKTYFDAVRKTIFAETVSMNFVMAGMIPTILFLKHHFPLGANPFTPLFWGIMSLATIVGFLFAYPINSWMVRKMIKHGMMSKPPAHAMKKEHQHHEMPTLSFSQSCQWTVISFVALFLTTYITSFFIPLKFI